MTYPITARNAWMILAIIVLFGAGCAGTTQPSRFYTLSPIGAEEVESRTEGALQGVRIGVGPVRLPELLDSPEIVTRTSPNRLEYGEFDRWAGSLKDNFSRVLAENLSGLLSTDGVVAYPWRTSESVDYQVVVDVVRFDGQLGENATLIARWGVHGKDEEKYLFAKRSVIHEPTRGSLYEDLVAAQSRALAAFCREIAGEIRNLAQ